MAKCEQCIIKSFNALRTLTHDELGSFSEHKTTISIKKGDNLMVEGKTIDLRRINTNEILYINLGIDEVTPDEINNIYNGVNS